MKTPEERYRTDAHFHMLVDMMEGFYHKAEYTPSEMREAAVLAAIHYEMKTVRPLRIAVGDPGEVPEFLRGKGW